MDHSDRISSLKGSQEEPSSVSSPPASEPPSTTPSTPCSAEPHNIFPSSSSRSSSASSTPDSAEDASNADEGSQSDWRIPQHDDPYTFLDPDEYFAQARAQQRTPTTRTPLRATPSRATPNGSADPSGAEGSPQFTSPPRYTARDQSKRTYYYSSYSTNFRRRRQRSESDGEDSSSDGSCDSDEDDDNYVAFDWKPLRLQVLVIAMCHLLGYLLSVALHLSYASSQWISSLSFVVATVPSLIGSPVQRTRWTSAAISLFALSKLFFPPIKPHLHGVQASSSSTLHSWLGRFLWAVICIGPHALGTTSSKQESTVDDDDDDDEAMAKRKRIRANGRAMLIFLTAYGVAWESLADWQQRQFYRTHAATQYCIVGLWTFAQHPDVLGSLCLWIGVWATHVESLVDSAWRPSARQRVAKRWRRYAQRYWRVLAATLLLVINVGTQWGRIAGLLGTRADTTHIHFGYGVDSAYTAFVDTVPLLWGTVAFDAQQHREYMKKKKLQSFQNQKETREAADRPRSTKAKSLDSAVEGTSQSNSSKKVAKVSTESIASVADPDNEILQSNRPLDDIVRWYAILEERYQDLDWGQVGDHGTTGPGISSTTTGSRESSRGAGRYKVPPLLNQDASTATKSAYSTDSPGLDDTSSAMQRRGQFVVSSSTGKDEADYWKQRILELVKHSKEMPPRMPIQREEVARSRVDGTIPVSSPLQQSLTPEASDSQSDGPLAATGELHTGISQSIVLGVQSIVDSGALGNSGGLTIEEDTPAQSETLKPTPEQRESGSADLAAVGTRIVDAYEASLRNAMEAFEVVVRGLKHPYLQVHEPERTSESDQPDSNRAAQSEQESLKSSKLTRSEVNESERDVGPARPSQAPELTSSSILSVNVNLGRSRAIHDELDAIAAKLVADSLATKDLRNARRAAKDEADPPPIPKQVTPLPHTRMGASRPSLTAHVNRILSKYVISADESFEQFVARHQAALKQHVRERSSSLSSRFSRFWITPSSSWTTPCAAWLEPLRVPRLRDLWLIDDDEVVEELDLKRKASAKARDSLFEKLRVDRLVDLWNVDLDSEMNVREEPLQRNPFEPLRVDRLRDLWLVDDF